HYNEEFNDQLNKLSKLDKDIAKNLLGKPPKDVRLVWDTCPHAIKGEELYRLRRVRAKKKLIRTSIESQQIGHTSRNNCYKSEFGKQQSQQLASNTHVGTQQSSPCEPEIGDDEDLLLRPKTIFKELTLLTMKKTRMRPPTDSRRIQFTGYSIGVSTPTNLPYSPKKLLERKKKVLHPTS
ncbi:hypothetical protein HAX54_019786, partial [Datura stramonium]|nr:hypothetical protein [Datura stramonium]